MAQRNIGRSAGNADRRQRSSYQKPEGLSLPSKSGPICIGSRQLSEGVWEERLSDGSVVVVTDLTSSLWMRKDETKLTRAGDCRCPACARAARQPDLVECR